MDSSASDLHRDGRVEQHDSSFKGLQVQVLVWEHPELWDVVDTKSDSRRYVLLVWSEPRISLGLLENVVQEGIVPVVVHREQRGHGGSETTVGDGDERRR